MTDHSVCAWCPRLCRHVCPVAVGTGLESATPTAMRAVALGVEAGALPSDLALPGTDLCLGCGACTAFCALHVDVPAALDAFRAARGAPVVVRAARGGGAAPLEAAAAVEPLRFVTCFEGPVLDSADQLACCGRRDGFDAVRPDAAGAVAEENVRRFGGRAIVCADVECGGFLRAHGAVVGAPA